MHSTITDILKFNESFVGQKQYEQYITDKYPSTGIAILTCMDTRLTHLLPAALGLKNGDVKMIKNAGAMVNSLFSDTVRSLLIGIYELHVSEIMVIGHTECGVQGLTGEFLINQMKSRGILEEAISSLPILEQELVNWLGGFSEVTQSVRDTVQFLTEHPLIPEDIRISGYTIDIVTGKLTPV